MRLDVKPSPGLTRRAAMAGALAMGSAINSRKVFAQGVKTLVLAEPVHNLGYAPVYLAIDQGFFKSRDLDVSLVVATNGAHVTALVSGQVWGNIGGPESDAMANVGKADPLRAICNLVNRANVYVVARKGTGPKSSSNADIAAFLKGKRFALSRYGGTPDLLGRWLTITVGLDPKTDIEAVNQADNAAVVAMMKNGAVDVGVTQEPYITAGIEQGLVGSAILWVSFLGRLSVLGGQRSPIHHHRRAAGRPGVRRCGRASARRRGEGPRRGRGDDA